MSNAVPHEVIGLAIVVNILSFLAVFLGCLLCLMLWKHGEGLSYILMLSIGTTLGAINGVVTHLDYTLNWREIQIQRYKNANNPEYEIGTIGKSDSGWRSGLGWFAIYTYNLDSLIVLFWATTLFIGTWNIQIKPEKARLMSIIFKIAAVVLPAIMVGLCHVESVQQLPVLFLVLVNIIMTVSMVFAFILVLAILYKYVTTRHVYKGTFEQPNAPAAPDSSMGTKSNVTTVKRSGLRKPKSDKWLIVRFSVIVLILVVFEAALIIYEIVNFNRSHRAHELRYSSDKGPNISAEQAKVDLSQYIPEIVPSIIAFCIFGTTDTCRKEYSRMIKRYVCWCARDRHDREDPSPWMKLQSGPATTPASFDTESSQQQASSAGDAKLGLAVEIKTEVSLSEELAGSPAGKGPYRVSFGGKSIISKGPMFPPTVFGNYHSSTSVSSQQLQKPVSRGGVSMVSQNPSPLDTSRSLPKPYSQQQSGFPPKLQESSIPLHEKPLPNLPPLPPVNTQDLVKGHSPSPSRNIPAHDARDSRRVTFSDKSSVTGASWLAMESKQSSVYSKTESLVSYSPSLFPPPLSVPRGCPV